MNGSKCVVVSNDVGRGELALAFLKTRFAEHSAVFLCDGSAFSFLQNGCIEVESVASGEAFFHRLDQFIVGNGIDCAICTTGIISFMVIPKGDCFWNKRSLSESPYLAHATCSL